MGAEELQALADAIRKPPHHLSEDRLWQAYAAIEKDKVRGVGARHILTDLVSLVRFALDQDNELVPFAERVDTNFKAWLAQQSQCRQTIYTGSSKMAENDSGSYCRQPQHRIPGFRIFAFYSKWWFGRLL